VGAGAATAPQAVAEAPEPTTDEAGWARALPFAAIAVGCAPVLLAMAWAIGTGWWPAADNALVGFRSLDVFSSNTPLVGMPSTVGTGIDAVGFHLGPTVFWALALPVRLFGGLGLALGAGAVNLASIVGIGVLCRRRGGTGLLVVVMAVAALVAASLGRDLLVSPWNPHIALLPMLLMFVAAWLTAEGRSEALPVLALAGTFVAQAHLGYMGIAGVTGAFAVVGYVWRVRRDFRPGAAHLATAVILVVCWAPVLWQQVTSDPGNLTLVARNFTDPQDDPVGGEFGTDAVAWSVGVPPLWARGPLEERDVIAIYTEPGALRVVTAAAVVLVLGGLLAAMWRRRTDRALVPLVVGGLVVLAGTWLTASRLPVALPAPYRIRWLWPVAGFVWLAAGLGVASMARRARAPVQLLGTVLAGALIFSLVAAASDPGTTEAQDTGALDAIDELADGAAPEIEDGTWLVRAGGREAFLVVRTGLVWRLRERDLDARMPAGEDDARARMGKEITATDDEADGVLLVSSGPGADEDHGGRLLARSDGSPDDRREELLDTKARLVELLEREGPTITASGQGRPREDLDELQAMLDRDPTELAESRFLEWVDVGFLELPGDDPDFREEVMDYRRWYLERQFRLELLPRP
jgi:hypothetical protein